MAATPPRRGACTLGNGYRTKPGILGFSLLVLLLAAGDWASAQMDEPLEGQGDEPANTTKVHVSAFLERLLDVDDRDFRFTAKVLVYMNWVDPRARDLILERSQEVDSGTGPACERVCDGPMHGRSTWQACCDTVWLPDFNVVNVEELPEGRVLREEIGLVGDGSQIVTWFTSVQGTFYTDMNVVDYPFDEQDLVMQFKLDTQGSDANKVELVPSASGELYEVRTREDRGHSNSELEDWSVTSVEVRITEASVPDDIVRQASTCGTE